MANPAITKDITFTDNGSVIARISDGVNVISGTTYEVTNIAATSPVITVNPTIVTVILNSTYTDTGVTATDSAEGDITKKIVTTGTVDMTVEGTYTLTYNVSDTAGNIAEIKTRIVNVIQGEYTFDYTGNYQTFTVPITGTYKVELWGGGGGQASAGSGSGSGGASFISGHSGCDAINSNGTHTGQPNHYSGYVFTETQMQTGVRVGNGQVIITYIP